MNRDCLSHVDFTSSQRASMQKGDSPIPREIMATLPTMTHTNQVHHITRIKDRGARMNGEKAETMIREDLKRETMIVETMIEETTIEEGMINGTTAIDLAMAVATEVEVIVDTS